ncbi:MAG: ATP phosphoribosyltransferase [Acidobacteriota bacterium]|nr:ATP phosphoribosyltransferase [Acidobacteriota bacterium]
MKTERPDPNLPRGVQAFLFDAAERRRKAEDSVVRRLLEAGLREVILPVLDFADPYAGVTAEGDERIYRFLDRQGNTLALRADFTPMAARVVAPRLGALSGAVSLFYRGDVVRDEEAGVGRRREFAQVGAERYGDGRPEADGEMLALALSCLGDLPAARLRLTLGWAGLLERLLASLAPGLAADGATQLASAASAARARHVTELETRLTAAGAAPAAAAEAARALLVGFEPASDLFCSPDLAGAAAELARAVAVAKGARPGLAVVVDLADAPQAPYYTGLTFSVDAANGGGTIAGGGRYDGLLGRFGAAAPALGFCIGLETLGAATEAGDTRARPLRIAVGKGRLLPKALEALRAGGASFGEPDGRRLLVPSADGAFELLLLKDDDVPTYVAHGGADLGIVGSDRVAESGEDVTCPVELPFGACRLSLIGRAGEAFRPNGAPVRVGTKYRRLAARYFDERKIAHEIVPLAGSVELAAALKLTDVVVDLIESGSTMAANGLAEIETILTSRATLILGRASLVARRAEIAAFVERIRTYAGAPT